jgi:hypothetical protein
MQVIALLAPGQPITVPCLTCPEFAHGGPPSAGGRWDALLLTPLVAAADRRW